MKSFWGDRGQGKHLRGKRDGVVASGVKNEAGQPTKRGVGDISTGGNKGRELVARQFKTSAGFGHGAGPRGVS